MFTEGLGSTVMPIILMVLVIVAAYYATRFVSVKTQRINKGKCLHIIDRVMIGKDKQILLLEAGETVYLVGVSGQAMTSIGSMSKEELGEYIPSDQVQQSAPAINISNMLKRAGSLLQVRNAVPSTEQWIKQRFARKSSKAAREKRDDIDDLLEAMDSRKGRARRAEEMDGLQ